MCRYIIVLCEEEGCHRLREWKFACTHQLTLNWLHYHLNRPPLWECGIVHPETRGFRGYCEMHGRYLFLPEVRVVAVDEEEEEEEEEDGGENVGEEDATAENLAGGDIGGEDVGEGEREDIRGGEVGDDEAVYRGILRRLGLE
ncbi:MAG: hypothetical protein LQ343_003778 [Gyalolechia ehrenbergii]|nr:MAG: hypothetical protein LQ343_003778 [Gyalolechia ehrenbergii]